MYENDSSQRQMTGYGRIQPSAMIQNAYPVQTSSSTRQDRSQAQIRKRNLFNSLAPHFSTYNSPSPSLVPRAN